MFFTIHLSRRFAIFDGCRVFRSRMEPVNGKLIGSPKKSKLSKSSDRRISVSVKTLEAAQTPAAEAEALRLFCRALIRLYLKDRAHNPENGKGLGIL